MASTYDNQIQTQEEAACDTPSSATVDRKWGMKGMLGVVRATEELRVFWA